MCLLAIAWNIHPRWRLVMAGNRDEAHERPTAALARWSDRPEVLAGRDLRSGGTWAGLDLSGRMTVVTNVRDPRIVVPQAPSRGALAADFLGSGLSASAYAGATGSAADAYAPFNMLVADANVCEYVSNYPHPRRMLLADGVHGLSNGDLDEPWPKTLRLMQVMSDWVSREMEDVDLLWRGLADEHLAPDPELPDTGVGLERERLLSAAFIRNPIYGTRASTLIAIDHQGHGWISERRFGPDGHLLGETTLSNRMPP
ncbi:NRDE family protein [Pseudoxanthomonas sp. 22568]|uniref:NRDE family protein n=1 Tax=Pseudoxanthomonas sp. 22568 TaxID=3453945 RepID=UPI003F87DA2C